MPRFESPWMFLLLLSIPAAFYLRGRAARRATVRFSLASSSGRLNRSFRQRLADMPAWVRAAALVLVVFALARPQQGTERVVDTSRGIAIEMVIDRSSSMSAELNYRGRRMTRLNAALTVFRQFVGGGAAGLAGRPSDLIGLITFARYADTVCPLTLAHETVLGFIPTIKLVERESEDGTAIGDAVALAAARLRTAEDTLARQGEGKKEYEIKSKVIILLTDGVDNAGRPPNEAADLAAAWGIKIYAIGIAGDSSSVIQTPFGNYTMPLGGGVDENTLRMLAERTGGLHRIVSDAEGLRAVYEEIDRLEKSEVTTTRYRDYRELFMPFALAALALLGAETLLGATLFRRIP
ncbi:MAG: VWA domain-containing protein [Bryobacteraceae bacterium]|nr:VWA domain-containing protein [Bryobacteraceae bacterium]